MVSSIFDRIAIFSLEVEVSMGRPEERFSGLARPFYIFYISRPGLYSNQWKQARPDLTRNNFYYLEKKIII